MTDTTASPDRGSADNATAWCISAALATLPLLLLLPVDFDRFLPLALVPALLVGTLKTRALPMARGSGLWWWCAGLAALGSSLLSDHAARSLVTTSAWCLTVAGGFMAARAARSERAIKIILGGLVGGGVIGLVLCRLMIVEGERGFPLYGHPRILGMHMLTAACAALMLLVLDRQANSARRAVQWATTVLLCGGLWWSGGRSPILGMLATLLCWSFWARDGDRRWLWARLPLIGALAGLAAWSAGSPAKGTGWLFPFIRTFASDDLGELTSGRTRVWQVATRIFDSPWYGQGADTYLFIRPRQFGDQPHNVLIQWMLDFGLLGTIPLVVILLGVIVRGSRA